jgi:hypothetical protein
MDAGCTPNKRAAGQKKAKIRAAIFMNRWLNDGEVEKWIKIIRKDGFSGALADAR